MLRTSGCVLSVPSPMASDTLHSYISHPSLSFLIIGLSVGLSSVVATRRQKLHGISMVPKICNRREFWDMVVRQPQTPYWIISCGQLYDSKIIIKNVDLAHVVKKNIYLHCS